jgi:hypothetical protein
MSRVVWIVEGVNRMRCRYCDKEIVEGIQAGVDDYVDSIHRFCDRICLDDYKAYLDDLDICAHYAAEYGD